MVRHGKWDIVRRKLKNEANVKMLNDCGESALSSLCEHTKVVPADIMSSLCHPDVINLADHSGYTPLMVAVLAENSECVLQLVSNGADVKMTNQFGNTAFSLALKRYKNLTSESYTKLVNPGMINFVYGVESEAVYETVSRKNFKAFCALVQSGVHLTISNDFGRQLLVDCVLSFDNISLSSIRQLFGPSNVPLDPEICVRMLIKWQLEFHELPAAASQAFVRVLLQTKSEDFFNTNRIQIETKPRNGLQYHRNNCAVKLPISGLFVLCILSRKGLRSKVCPIFLQRLATLVTPQNHLHTYFMNQVTRLSVRTNALFEAPFTLVDECASIIRANIQNPTEEKIHQLGLPKKLSDIVGFKSLGRELYDLLAENAHQCEYPTPDFVSVHI